MEQKTKYWIYKENTVPLDLASKIVKYFNTFIRQYAIDEKTTKTTNQQPLFALFSHPKGLQYKYFKTTVPGFEFPQELIELLKVAHTMVENKYIFNAAFVNLYRDGKDCVTPHRDNTHGLDHPILSFS